MKMDSPVTQQEYVFKEDITLMSTTDPQSKINYANSNFIAVSGYTRQELTDRLHNIVRHPDMPREAFRDMWFTLKQGEPWTGLVKNRRKNGDHYWVRANVVPVIRNGVLKGYMSVRIRPCDEEIKKTEQFYNNLRNGKIKGVAFFKGVVVRTGIMRWRSLLKTLPLRWRLRSVFFCLLALSALAGAVLCASAASAALFTTLAGLILFIAALFLEAQIIRPIERLRRQALAVVTGDYSRTEHIERVDEIGMTLRAVNQLGLMFRWLVDDVSAQALSVLKTSDILRTTNEELNQHTHRAASNVEQTVAAMHQMLQTVQSNTGKTAQADALSHETRNAAIDGGQAINNMAGIMTAIIESAKEITSIISIIDGIAFQTNILALNAAVEAARAGKQGKGFAVVADEVRQLAQRSASAACDIKLLVETSAAQVNSGSSGVKEACGRMDEIVERIKIVTALIAEISDATVRQTQALANVNKAVEELDNLTQHNAQRVEENALAALKMHEQARRLAEAISVFR
jgi:aerotaxis receptor